MNNEFKPEDMIKSREELINGIYKYADRLEKVNKIEIVIGNMSKEDLIKELKHKKIIISNQAKDLMESPEFSVSRRLQHLDLVSILVSDLGFTETATFNEIYEKVQALGLEYCPAEVGPQLRLQSDRNAYLMIGMKPIKDKNNNRNIFGLSIGDENECELDCNICDDSIHYYYFDKFVFCKIRE